LYASVDLLLLLLFASLAPHRPCRPCMPYCYCISYLSCALAALLLPLLYLLYRLPPLHFKLPRWFRCGACRPRYARSRCQSCERDRDRIKLIDTTSSQLPLARVTDSLNEHL
jgi:hypothetical protein